MPENVKRRKRNRTKNELSSLRAISFTIVLVIFGAALVAGLHYGMAEIERRGIITAENPFSKDHPVFQYIGSPIATSIAIIAAYATIYLARLGMSIARQQTMFAAWSSFRVELEDFRKDASEAHHLWLEAADTSLKLARSVSYATITTYPEISSWKESRGMQEDRSFIPNSNLLAELDKFLETKAALASYAKSGYLNKGGELEAMVGRHLAERKQHAANRRNDNDFDFDDQDSYLSLVDYQGKELAALLETFPRIILSDDQDKSAFLADMKQNLLPKLREIYAQSVSKWSAQRNEAVVLARDEMVQAVIALCRFVRDTRRSHIFTEMLDANAQTSDVLRLAQKIISAGSSKLFTVPDHFEDDAAPSEVSRADIRRRSFDKVLAAVSVIEEACRAPVFVHHDIHEHVHGEGFDTTYSNIRQFKEADFFLPRIGAHDTKAEVTEIFEILGYDIKETIHFPTAHHGMFRLDLKPLKEHPESERALSRLEIGMRKRHLESLLASLDTDVHSASGMVPFSSVLVFFSKLLATTKSDEGMERYLTDVGVSGDITERLISAHSGAFDPIGDATAEEL